MMIDLHIGHIENGMKRTVTTRKPKESCKHEGTTCESKTLMSEDFGYSFSRPIACSLTQRDRNVKCLSRTHTHMIPLHRRQMGFRIGDGLKLWFD